MIGDRTVKMVLTGAKSNIGKGGPDLHYYHAVDAKTNTIVCEYMDHLDNLAFGVYRHGHIVMVFNAPEFYAAYGRD